MLYLLIIFYLGPSGAIERAEVPAFPNSITCKYAGAALRQMMPGSQFQCVAYQEG